MSVWTDLVAFALNEPLGFQDVNEMIGNLVALKEFPKTAKLGGDPKAIYVGTAYAICDDPVYFEIDGTNLAGATYELHFMGYVTAADTGFVQLVRDPIGTPAQITEKQFTNTTLDLVKSAAFTLTTGVNKYGVRVKATTGGAASPFVAYGFQLVQR